VAEVVSSRRWLIEEVEDEDGELEPLVTAIRTSSLVDAIGREQRALFNMFWRQDQLIGNPCQFLQI
jgi:hypothetical protein